MIPARRILIEAEAESKRLGHENLGFLSESHGYMPTSTPSLQLSSPTHEIWDETAAALPEMFRRLTLRRTLEQMPVLSAAPANLPDSDVLRASVIFGLFAHAYHYVQPEAYERIPESIQRPWQEISQRLQQPAPHLSFIDMNVYNYRHIRLYDPDPMRMENLALLVPILGNEAERRFQMTPTEIMARFTPVFLAGIRAQEAVAAENPAALRDELRLIADALQSLVYGVFNKVNPNSYHPLYVNPVVWGKTVAPLATPFTSGIPGPSGTAIPAFQQLDILFGRGTHATNIGKETSYARKWFPPNWRNFLDACEAISVVDFVREVADPKLTGAFQSAVDAYAGETGLLGRHRLKTYGFLDLSFKAGRSKTLGGFAGSFDERLWDKMDAELNHARLERYTRYPQVSHYVLVKSVSDVRREGENWVKQISFDLTGTGLTCQPGDRCAVLPENDPALVQKTLDALGARGDEPIALNALWREAVKQRDGYEGAKVLSLRSLLTFGVIRPVSRAAAKTLYGVTHHEGLRRILEARAEDQWELWDLLKLLVQSGFDTRRLWKAEPGEAERICRVVPPEAFRIYSVSAIVTAPQHAEITEIQLMVGGLTYQTHATEFSRTSIRGGVGSHYLARLADPQSTAGRRVSIKLIHPPRFSLPTDAKTPIILFAGGTGLSPFRSLLQARLHQADSGENWLFFGTRTPDDLYYAGNLEKLIALEKLHLRAAFSRADVGLTLTDGHFSFPPAPRGYIDAEMLREENAAALYDLLTKHGATVYVCGHANFALTVTNAIKMILSRYGGGPDVAQQTFYRLVGEDRYLQEVFTTYAGAHFAQQNSIDASAVVDYNNDSDGYRAIIDGRVYDLSEFAHLHPGGFKIIRSYAGMDATAAYRMAQHNVNPEVDALLPMYEMGVVRRLDLGSGWGVALSPEGLKFVTLQDVYRVWVRLLYQVVEMENALANDFSVRGEPMTHDETLGPIAPSLYRWQHYLQSHLRFRRDYQAKIIGEPLQHLWLLTGSLCDERAEAGWMQNQIERVLQSEPAHAMQSFEASILTALHESVPSLDLEAACIHLEQSDKAFLRQIKRGLRAGLTVFEQYESRTLMYGRDSLMSALMALPGVLGEYFDRVVLQTD